MTQALALLERVPATILVLPAVVSINLGSALAIGMFPIYGTFGMLFLRMALAAALLSYAYRNLLLDAIRLTPGGKFVVPKSRYSV